MGRPPLTCVFCFDEVQETEERYRVYKSYLGIWPGKPICVECFQETFSMPANAMRGWHFRGDVNPPTTES